MAANPSTTQSYHCSGPVVVYATVGALSAYVPVGVCEDGIQLDFITYRRPIKTDGAGGPEGGPANYYFLNACVVVKCALVPYAGTYVNRLRLAADAHNITGTVGTLSQAGTMFGPTTVAGSLIGVAFASNDVDGGWLFPLCLVKTPGNAKWSPKETKPAFEFHANGFYNGNTVSTINGLTLYSRT